MAELSQETVKWALCFPWEDCRPFCDVPSPLGRIVGVHNLVGPFSSAKFLGNGIVVFSLLFGN